MPTKGRPGDINLVNQMLESADSHQVAEVERMQSAPAFRLFAQVHRAREAAQSSDCQPWHSPLIVFMLILHLPIKI